MASCTPKPNPTPVFYIQEHGSSLFLTASFQDTFLTFLLDTGACVSLLSAQQCPPILRIFPSTVQLQGVSGSLSSQGFCYLPFYIPAANVQFHQKFHIVPSNFASRFDGILGDDFLRGYHAIIDYSTYSLTLFNASLRVRIPIIKDPSRFVYTIPPRSEKIISAPCNHLDDRVLPSTELAPGVFLTASISRPRNGSMYCRILNTTDQPYKAKNLSLHTEPTANYSVLHYSQGPCDENRIQKLLSLLPLQHLQPSQSKLLRDLCCTYADIFFLPGDSLTVTNLTTQAIPLKEHALPRFIKPYRVPHAQKSDIENHIAEMKRLNLIEPSLSPWNSPLILLPKTERRSRIVIDYRYLNTQIQDDHFPLPNITDILDRLGRAQYFSTLDLSQGYYQVALDADSRPCTAFTADSGHWQMTRLPMGLRISPNAFSRIISLALSDLSTNSCFVYLDDIIIFGDTLEKHNLNLQKVFHRLREVNFKLNPGKCKFLQTNIVYLGHHISPHGIRPDPQKTLVVSKYPRPTNTDDVRRFVAFCNYYRRFVHNFAHIAAPLNLLLKKDQPFVWSDECEAAFCLLREKLISAPTLAFPDFSRPFTVHTDASQLAISGILSNADGHPIAYASRSLNKAERNYPTIEKELLAIVWACTKAFRPYLLGKPFTVFSDHRPLQYLYSFNNSSARLIKFRLALAEYNFTITYIPGAHNAPADALSRAPVDIEELRSNMCNVVQTRSQTRAQMLDPVQSPNKNNTQHDTFRTSTCSNNKNHDNNDNTNDNHGDNKNFPGSDQPTSTVPRLIADTAEQQALLAAAHFSPTAGHPGINRMYQTMKLRWYWPNMVQDITNLVNSCLHCNQAKFTPNPTVPMTESYTASSPFEQVLIDIVGPLPATDNNHKYILTVQDNLSKFLELIPLPNKTAQAVAQALVEHIFLRYGLPVSILSDNGTEFINETFRKICDLLSIDHRTSTPYHHQTIGALENTHRVLNAYLRIFSSLTDWDNWLPYFAFSYNSSVHSATGYMPHQLLFGKLPNLPHFPTNTPAPPIYNYDDYFSSLRNKLHNLHSQAFTNQIHTKHHRVTSQPISHPTIPRPGDSVLVRSYTTHKLENPFIGPFKVTAVNFPNIQIALPNNSVKTLHLSNVKLHSVD